MPAWAHRALAPRRALRFADNVTSFDSQSDARQPALRARGLHLARKRRSPVSGGTLAGAIVAEALAAAEHGDRSGLSDIP